MGELSLVFHAGTHLCALRLEHVVEIMRPLPVEPLAGAPSFVAGVCVVRGQPAPVIDAAALVGGEAHPVTRYISVKADVPVKSSERRPPGEPVSDRPCPVIFAVTSVRGVWEVATDSVYERSPLLGAGTSDLIGSLGVIGHEPLLFLRGSAVLSDLVRPAGAEQPFLRDLTMPVDAEDPVDPGHAVDAESALR